MPLGVEIVDKYLKKNAVRHPTIQVLEPDKLKDAWR